MLDDVATDIDAAPLSKDGPVLERRPAPASDPLGTLARDLKPMPVLDLKLQRAADAFFASPGAEDGSDAAITDEPSASLREPSAHLDAQRQVPSEDAQVAPTGRPASAGKRILRFGASAIGIAALCGLAWTAGAHQFPSRLPFPLASRGPEPQQSAQRDALVGAVRQMGEDLRALEARVDAKTAAPNASADPVQSATTNKAVAGLANRLADMDANLAAKLSRIDERLAALEQRAPAAHAPEVARAQPPRHRAKHIHDAFDPSQDPNAPGAPRPLGR